MNRMNEMKERGLRASLFFAFLSAAVCLLMAGSAVAQGRPGPGNPQPGNPQPGRQGGGGDGGGGPHALNCDPHSFPQRTQHSFAANPTDDRLLFIGVEQEGFFKSIDGGASWQRATTGIKSWPRMVGPGPCYEEFYSTVIDSQNPDNMCIALAGGPGLLSSPSSAGNNGVYCSTDAGETWTQRVTPTMNTAIYTLSVDPTDFNIMYAGANGGPCSNPPPVCPPDTYFNTIGAIYKTTDGGLTWTELDALYQLDLKIVDVRVSEQDPNVVIAASFSKLPNSVAGPGQFAGRPQLGVLRSTDAGRTWTSSTQGMNADPREQGLLDMEIAPQNAQRVFVTASSNRSYWSDDGGQSFHGINRLTAFAFDPHDPGGLHMLGSNGESIVESRDGGASWTKIASTPGFVTFMQGVPTHVEWSRTDPSHIFLAGPYAAVYESRNGGVDWTQILSADRLPN